LPFSTSPGSRPHTCGRARPIRAARYTILAIAKSDIVKVKEDEAATDASFNTVLREAVATVERAGFRFLVLGGLASSLVGRPRWTHDIDFLVRADDALGVLSAFRAAGFRTEETDPVWIYKAFRHDIMVDIIFMITGGIYLDQQMEERAIQREYDGLQVRIPSPEDQVVIKAIVHREETSRHWFDALAILGRADLEWDYLLYRARLGARRVLALLVYAQSTDILVPTWVIRRLYDEVYAQ
jgi:predicted nucleotidyltransferase